MNTEDITIGKVTFQVRQLNAKEGMPILMGAADGNIDMSALLEIAVSTGGNPIKADEISVGVAAKLLPVIMRVNDMEAGEESGN